jgi:hypothetical protein
MWITPGPPVFFPAAIRSLTQDFSASKAFSPALVPRVLKNVPMGVVSTRKTPQTKPVGRPPLSGLGPGFTSKPQRANTSWTAATCSSGSRLASIETDLILRPRRRSRSPMTPPMKARSIGDDPARACRDRPPRPRRACPPAPGRPPRPPRPQLRAGRHAESLCAALEALERREIRRLLVQMPPRHGKTLHVSQGFPAWWLGRHPTDSIILASYAAELAESNSRRARGFLTDPRWPFAGVEVSPESAAVNRWNTTDDPVKDRRTPMPRRAPRIRRSSARSMSASRSWPTTRRIQSSSASAPIPTASRSSSSRSPSTSRFEAHPSAFRSSSDTITRSSNGSSRSASTTPSSRSLGKRQDREEARPAFAHDLGVPRFASG